MSDSSSSPVAQSGGTTANRLIRTEDYSDLTIVCQGRNFPVHKVVLCSQSDVISELCDIDAQGQQTGKIEDTEFDGDTMDRMINFAYEKSYEVTRRPKYLPAEHVEDPADNIDPLLLEDASTSGDAAAGIDALEPEGASATGGVTIQHEDENVTIIGDVPDELSPTDQMVIHTRVYGLAEYYNMPELRDYACKCFNRAASNELDPKGFVKVVRAVCREMFRADGSLCNPYDSPLRASFFASLTEHAPELARDQDFLAAIYEPNIRAIVADIFIALGERIAELEKEKLEAIAILEVQNDELQQSLAMTKGNAEEQVLRAPQQQRAAEDQLQHNDGVTPRLMSSLRDLPASCASNSCSNEFRSLRLELNGNGDWEVRCGAKNCRFKLN